MIQRRFIIILLFWLLAPGTDAAPPAGGITPLEQRVRAGCKFANLVFIAKVVNLQARHQTGGELQTGDLKLIELLKGRADEVPKTISNFKYIPRPTDSLKEDLEDKMTYLIFLNAPAAPGWEGIIPRLHYDGLSNQFTDDRFHSAVTVARSACR